MSLLIIVFDLRGCTTLKIGKLSGHISSVTPRSLRRLHWMLIPGSLALDTVLGLLPRLLKQSTLASIQWTWDQCTLEVNLGNEDVLIPGQLVYTYGW